MFYIYKIQNTQNLKLYIGFTNDFKRRFIEHRRELNFNRHTNTYLQNSWNKNKPESFIFKVIYSTESDQFGWEQFFLDLYSPEYNLSNKCFDPPQNQSKEFSLIDPFGNLVTGENLKDFCLRNGLTYSCMHLVHKGKKDYYLGWTKNLEKHQNYKLWGKTPKDKQRVIRLKNEDNKIFLVYNRVSFSNKHNLDHSNLLLLISGKRNSHRGFSLVN